MPQPIQTPDFAPVRPAPTPQCLRVAASSLLVAGLLGACATAERPSMGAANQAGSMPAPAAAPAKEAGLPLIATLKNAETALTDYARSRHRESGLREALQTAETAALVARHRYTIGVADYLAVSQAERQLAQARQELEAGVAATLVARNRLYRAFGLGGDETRRGGAALSVPVSSRLEPAPFASARVI